MRTSLAMSQSLAILSWLTVCTQAGTPSCGGLLSRAASLDHVSRNLVLGNHVLRSYAKRSPFVCVAACIRDDRCVSVNYGGTGGICELNGSSKADHPEDMEVRDGWKHYGMLPGSGTLAETEICPTITTTDTATTVETTTSLPTTNLPTTTLPTTQPTTTLSTTTLPTTTLPTTTLSTTTLPTTTLQTTAIATTILPTTTLPPTTQQQTTIPATTAPTTVFVTTEKPAVDCWEIHASSPSLPSGEYSVYPETRAGPLQVYCDMETDGGGWTVFQRRRDDTQDFYRNWASYKEGFGDISGNFWLGNDALHELTTQQDYQLRVELRSFTEISTYAKYGLFVVANEANKYRLTVGTFYGSFTADDSLSYHSGQDFSTSDQDNDSDDARHCAQAFLGAWWYTACLSSNLNGPYINTANVEVPGQGVIWGSWPSVYVSQNFAEMKLRPVSAQSVPKDCWDHYMQGQTASGLYSVYVTGLAQALQVYCDMDDVGGGWTVIQRRVDGTQDFYKYWADYKAGFGDLNGEFWLGNDNLHLLTNQAAYQLTVKMQSWDAVTKYANYNQFSVADEADLYRLSVSGFAGSSGIGDSMDHHNGIVWSTRDRENDNDVDRHCAQYEVGAWWYNACETSNLNGPYVDYPGTLTVENSGRGIMWGTWKYQRYSFPRAEMKVRPAHVGFTE